MTSRSYSSSPQPVPVQEEPPFMQPPQEVPSHEMVLQSASAPKDGWANWPPQAWLKAPRPPQPPPSCCGGGPRCGGRRCCDEEEAAGDDPFGPRLVELALPQPPSGCRDEGGTASSSSSARYASCWCCEEVVPPELRNAEVRTRFVAYLTTNVGPTVSGGLPCSCSIAAWASCTEPI